jgi:protein arginine kinase
MKAKGHNITVNALTQQSCEWLKGTGPEADIVISSRIRLARNLAGYPFMSRADEATRDITERYLRDRLLKLNLTGGMQSIDVSELEPLDRQFLVERQMISREHSEGRGRRCVVFNNEQNLSAMVNEEDHLRLQVLHSGYCLQECWEQINKFDDMLEEVVSYAFDPEFGYLTACPTNTGTGIRVSVMLHLPGLVATKEIQKVFHGLTKISLAVRGLYGEGSQAMGDFYQISNQVTLGKSELEMIETINKVVPKIIEYERLVRTELVKKNKLKLHDQVSRALGTLRSARAIASEETMHLLSSVRMGINLGLIKDLDIPTVNELFIFTQPAHLQKIKGEAMDVSERNSARAAYLREKLASLPE